MNYDQIIAAAEAEAQAAKDELDAMHERAGGAPLTDGQQDRWDRVKKRHDDARARAREAAAEVAERHAEIERAIANGSTVPGTSLPGDSENHRTLNRAGTGPEAARALRSIHADRFLPDHGKERVTQMIEREDASGSGDTLAARWAAAASNPHYLRAYASLLVDPDRGHLSWTEAERAAFNEAQTVSRAMSIGTDASGGYMVPVAIDPAVIITNDGTTNPFRQIARTATTVTDSWKGITSAGVTAEWKAEAAEAADASPSDLAQPTIPVHLADAYLVYSIEAEQDIPTLVDEMQTMLLDSKERHEATAFTTGDGSGKPKGVITAVAADAGSLVTPTTAEAFAVADVYKVAGALGARHALNARWAANYSVELLIRQMASGDQTHAFWSDLGGGTPPTLLGKPWHQASDMDGAFNAAATANNYFLLFGDFSKYLIVDRVGARTELVPHVVGSNRRPTGQRGLFFYWRVGADALDTNAFRLLNIATTA